MPAVFQHTSYNEIIRMEDNAKSLKAQTSEIWTHSGSSVSTEIHSPVNVAKRHGAPLRTDVRLTRTDDGRSGPIVHHTVNVP
jgi:hypothetical protein